MWPPRTDKKTSCSLALVSWNTCCLDIPLGMSPRNKLAAWTGMRGLWSAASAELLANSEHCLPAKPVTLEHGVWVKAEALAGV